MSMFPCLSSPRTPGPPSAPGGRKRRSERNATTGKTAGSPADAGSLREGRHWLELEAGVLPGSPEGGLWTPSRDDTPSLASPSTEFTLWGWKREAHRGPSFVSPPVHGLGPTHALWPHQAVTDCVASMTAAMRPAAASLCTASSRSWGGRCLSVKTRACAWRLWGDGSRFPAKPQVRDCSPIWASYLLTQNKSFF